MNGKYRITIDFEYKNQNKRGGRPTIIKIPKGTIGEKRGGELIFHTLSRKGHNPFVFWVDAYLHVEKVET